MASSFTRSILEEESLGEALLRAMAPTITALLATLVLIVAVGFVSIPFLSSDSRENKIPRPKGALPIFFNTFQILKYVDHILDWVTCQCETQQGRPWQLQILGRSPTIIVSTPELIENVLFTQFDNFGKGAYAEENGYDLFGSGIFVVDGHRWVRQRKTASTLLTQRALKEYIADTVNEQTQILAKLLQRKVDRQKPIDVSKLFNRFTFEVFTETGFDVKIGGLKGDTEDSSQTAFDAAQRLLLQRFMVPSWFWRAQRYLNIGAEKELKSCMTLIDDTVYDIISQSMKNQQMSNKAKDSGSSIPDGRKDIISLFLDSLNHDSQSDVNSTSEFDSKYLRDVVFSFLLAGRDTTAQTLSWFLYCLSQNPNTEQRVREELAPRLLEVGGAAGREEAFAPPMDQLHQLVYLEAAIKVTLRLYPSVPGNEKHCLRGIVLCDGTFVKAGMNVGHPGYALGQMTHVWGPDAKKFKPERWTDSETSKLTPVSTSKFNVSHAGPRMYLGMSLAMMEMKTVATVLLSKFRFELVPGQEITYDLSITLSIKGALTMVATPNVPSSS